MIGLREIIGISMLCTVLILVWLGVWWSTKAKF